MTLNDEHKAFWLKIVFYIEQLAGIRFAGLVLDDFCKY